MSPQQNEQFEQLAAGYFDGTLDDVQAQRFVELLHSDDRRVQRFAELAQLHQMIASEIAYAKQAERFDLNRTPSDSASASAMAELLGNYVDGRDTPIDFTTWRETQKTTRNSKRHKTLTNRWILGSAIAAMLVLAGMLAVVFSGGDTPEQPYTDNTPNMPSKPASSTQSTPRGSTVATLTASHSAQWAGAASAAPTTGDTLHPGTTLTLTQGFATITTNRGAIAILEAPATIELLDHNNAIRLHTGKLVGICETESSKGFLVRTSQMDITDLGTRFGVDASGPDSTEVHVLQGKVEVAGLMQAPGVQRRHTLVAGQAMGTKADSGALVAISIDAQRFASIDPRMIPLVGTGQGLSQGDVDPNWQIVAVNGQPVTQSGEMYVSHPGSRPQGAEPDDPATSQWLSVVRPFEQADQRPENRFTCRTHIDLPIGVDPSTLMLHLRFDADERIDQVRINGQAFDLPKHSYTDENPLLNEVSLRPNLTPGKNTIEFDVIDLIRGGGSTWGLRVQWHLGTNSKKQR